MESTAPKRRHRRRLAAILVAAAIGIGSVTALAYFLTRGTSSTSVTAPVGGTPPPIAFTLLTTNVAPGPITPGSGMVEYNINATNPTSTPLTFALTATVKTDGVGGVYDNVSSAFVDGCKASWFTTQIGEPVGWQYSLPANATNIGIDHVIVKMTESGTDQSACENLSPEVDVAAS